ncbi:hypothetical protein N7540_011371 [Penicillium herquei]|nr:hypothetical protein N7540_011371 [Penicillium herquei]
MTEDELCDLFGVGEIDLSDPRNWDVLTIDTRSTKLIVGELKVPWIKLQLIFDSVLGSPAES